MELKYFEYEKANIQDDDDDSDSFVKFQSFPVAGLVTFSSEFPDELGSRLGLKIWEKQGGNDTKRFDDKIVALFDKVKEKNCVTRTQHKKNLITLKLI